jgi:transposase InsO family protein
MTALHDSPVGGHSGFPVTLARIKRHFAWPKMRATIKEYVQGCGVCQQAKPDRSKYPGLLQPLETPDAAWDVVTLDFVEGLPISSKFDCILVVVDKLTRYAHFIPLSHPYTAQTVAKEYMDKVFKLHGMPLALVSDRDKVFTSQFWQHLFKASGTQLRMSTAYHPQTDGQTERVNQCMETYLRCFTHACPRQWSRWLALAEYWYNTSCHSSLGKSPFAVLYGREPRQLDLSDLDVEPVTDVQDWLEERKGMMDLLKLHLNRAQHRMKVQADKKRTERSFQVGDSVFLKLQPYVQSSVAHRSNHKLSFKFYGPYQVLARVGSVAYRLKLPEESKVHPVFHVSQLKRVRHQPTQVMSSLPDMYSVLQVPLSILEYRWLKEANRMSRQGLVSWTNADSTATTWENLEDLHRRFPEAPAWAPEQVLEARWSTNKAKPRQQVKVAWNYSTPDKATWEDLDIMRRKYPATAWGQAEGQGEGIVSSTTTDQAQLRTRRSDRRRVPNSRVVGPDWVGPAQAQRRKTKPGSAPT